MSTHSLISQCCHTVDCQTNLLNFYLSWHSSRINHRKLQNSLVRNCTTLQYVDELPLPYSLFCWITSLPQWPESVPRTLWISRLLIRSMIVLFPPPLRKVTGRFLSPNKTSTVFSAILGSTCKIKHAQFPHQARPWWLILAPYKLISAINKVS